LRLSSGGRGWGEGIAYIIPDHFLRSSEVATNLFIWVHRSVQQFKWNIITESDLSHMFNCFVLLLCRIIFIVTVWPELKTLTTCAQLLSTVFKFDNLIQSFIIVKVKLTSTILERAHKHIHQSTIFAAWWIECFFFMQQ
jgi:hypothetical protein